MNNSVKKYLNKAQLEAMIVGAHTEVDICGRRFGKSFGIVSLRIKRNVEFMPGSTGAFIASSYKQANTRTLPAALSGLAEFGWYEGIHYVIGKKPSPKLGYKKPLIPLNNHDDVVSFYNGAQMIIISQDVKLGSNSMTLDWLIGDEAKGLNFEKLKDETFPANGGTRRYFSECPWHHSILFVSDMPVLKSARWLLNYREKATPDLIDAIKGLLYERWHVYTTWPEGKEKEWKLSGLEKLINQLRAHAVFYREWSTFENVDVVGLKYIKQMKRDLPPLVFQTSILSKRIERLSDGFYPNFRDNLHTYIANNNTPLQDIGYSLSPGKDLGCLLDGDLDLKAPIAIAFDYNANINWLVAGQRDGMKLKILKSFFVKYERKLRELVDDFCHYYRAHLSKEVVFYYDSTALGSNYAVSNDDFASVIVEQFHKHGWIVTTTFIGKPMKHSEKYSIINDGFRGAKHLLPMFNKENNEALLIAIHLAETTITPSGFHKAKGGEKLAENESDLLEHRTDGTDAFDTLYLGNVLYPYSAFGSGLGSGL
ncbi:MAG: hypothetical protein J5976_03805 [Bacteroidales bacterium]|nr:hypothetical protein [Bacteroidales bacterium]